MEDDMTELSRADLWSLEEYAEERPRFRAEVLAHKKTRQIGLGEHTRLYFEDALTIKYQIQEMLRIERVFEPAGIKEELDAYNPLIPDGHNWKATFMIEFADPAERAEQLARMVGIENSVWMQVGDCDRIYPIADEDLERSTDDKTSSVHFMRYELTPDMIAAAHRGEPIRAGIEHEAYPIAAVTLDEPVRASLVKDLADTQVH
jgi:hypothetical protein